MGDPSADRDADARRDHEPTTGAPRWVKVVGIIALVMVVIFIIFLLTGGPGRHGPGRHTGALGVASSLAGLTVMLPR
jgi:hypothetical protein